MSCLLNQQRKRVGQAADRLLLNNRDFTLFSNDCWGAEVYKHFGLPFNTPFIGLMLMAPCYLRLLKQARHYMSQPLAFQSQSRYEATNTLRAGWKHYFPIATLGNGQEADNSVEIQFLHYHSEAEALEKWNRRVARINWDNLFIKFDGSKDFATPALVREFDQLPYPHLTLLQEPLDGVASAIVVPEYTTDGMIQFERSRPCYNLVGWLNGGPTRPTFLSTLYHRALFSAIS